MNKGDEVICHLDWNRRFKNMQVHTAGHVLHEAVKTFAPDCNPLEAQHGKQAYFVYEGKIDKMLESRILSKANDIIDSSLEVHTEFVALDELKKRASWIPPKLPTNKPLRIMWIEGYEPIPDGGTQVRTTSEIAKFENITVETIDGNTKISYRLNFSTAKPEQSKPRDDSSSTLDSLRLQNIKSEAMGMIMDATDAEEIDRLRVHYLGKKGVLAEVAREIPNLSAEEKVDIGVLFNDVKTAITEALNSKSPAKEEAKDLRVDLLLPGISPQVGILHPISQTAREMNDIFKHLGFSVADGPEIETEEYNYSRLNLPPDHPARDLQDSIYIKEPDILLRTHVSSVEAHILADKKPPYRFVIPGKVYRYENLGAANHYMFYQYQGVAVGENLTMANLKWTLNTFIHKFFGPNRKTRFRCKYYPEVEPGVGVDIDCPFCNQKGCSVCKQRGWIEMLGAGMIHPAIFKRVGLDPQKYSGFAWGMGLDRITMARYNIGDIRSLFNGDLVYKV